MGTHPNGPSYLHADPSISLSKLISSDPVAHLSRKIAQEYNNGLPFLFKVLSVNKALSIQAHPDKKLAKQLFENFPKIYKDPNHKPELAIALTPFEALCGFRPISEIKHHLNTVPELNSLIPSTALSEFNLVSPSSEAYKPILKSLFTSVMSTDPSIISSKVTSLSQRLLENNIEYETGTPEELVLRLNNQFPGDVGIFCVYLLNYVTLKPGEAIYLGANEPHAYLSGDAIETMSASDNVIRAGLTPKFKDIPTLTSMLTYNSSPPSFHILKPTSKTEYTILYDPPIPDFSVLRSVVPKDFEIQLDKVGGPSLVLCTEGNGLLHINYEEEERKEVLQVGYVLFVGAGVYGRLKSDGNGPLVLYRAFCE